MRQNGYPRRTGRCPEKNIIETKQNKTKQNKNKQKTKQTTNTSESRRNPRATSTVGALPHALSPSPYHPRLLTPKDITREKEKEKRKNKKGKKRKSSQIAHKKHKNNVTLETPTLPLQDAPGYQATIMDPAMHFSQSHRGHVLLPSCLGFPILHASGRYSPGGTWHGGRPPFPREGGCASLYAPSCLR